MLIACPDCRRQWDATGKAVGEAVACACGRRLLVEQRPSRSPRPLRCFSCGGPLADAARACGFCGAEVTLEERLLSEVCPVCWARMAAGARFCMECGVKIAPQPLAVLPEGRSCPRCEGALRERRVGPTALVECTACAGLWVAAACFGELCRQAEQQVPAAAGLFPPEPRVVRKSPVPVKYIPCLACGQLMNRRNFAEISGVVVDVCKDHGVWLDHRELEQVLLFLRTGGARKAQERQERRRAQERRDQAARAADPGVPAGSWGASGPDFDGDVLVRALRWLAGRLFGR